MPEPVTGAQDRVTDADAASLARRYLVAAHFLQKPLIKVSHLYQASKPLSNIAVQTSRKATQHQRQTTQHQRHAHQVSAQGRQEHRRDCAGKHRRKRQRPSLGKVQYGSVLPTALAQLLLLNSKRRPAALLQEEGRTNFDDVRAGDSLCPSTPWCLASSSRSAERL